VISPVVEIETLTRRFDAYTAVGSLTQTANSGEAFGSLGSETGKSAITDTLATRLPPSPGEARAGGFSIATQPVETRGAIGYLKK
jgi:ABC-type multidrug transport system ATPase subunit